MAFHYGTDGHYETYGTVADTDDISRTYNPIEAIVNLLRTPEDIDEEEYDLPTKPDKKWIRLVLYRINRYCDDTPADARLMHYALSWAAECME